MNLTPACPDSTYENLVVRLKRGDQPALGDLYDRTSPAIYGLMLQLLGTGDKADDALIETYTRAWNGICVFNPQQTSLLTWLVVLARGVAGETLELVSAVKEPVHSRRGGVV
jgi:RNA polymerase sigma-70 factor, ECF subfamily